MSTCVFHFFYAERGRRGCIRLGSNSWCKYCVDSLTHSHTNTHAQSMYTHYKLTFTTYAYLFQLLKIGLITTATLPIGVPIVAGAAAFAGIYGAYKAATWHKCDDWRRGINGNVHMNTQCNVLCGNNMYYLGVIVHTVYVTL